MSCEHQFDMYKLNKRKYKLDDVTRHIVEEIIKDKFIHKPYLIEDFCMSDFTLKDNKTGINVLELSKESVTFNYDFIKTDVTLSVIKRTEISILEAFGAGTEDVLKLTDASEELTIDSRDIKRVLELHRSLIF